MHNIDINDQQEEKTLHLLLVRDFGAGDGTWHGTLIVVSFNNQVQHRWKPVYEVKKRPVT